MPSATTNQGYGKENIGRNSKFLQGEETEGYMVEEIMHALQQHEPLCCKLHNHKADGRKFQNLLCLHPVFGKEGEYLYQESSSEYRRRAFAWIALRKQARSIDDCLCQLHTRKV